MSILVDAFSGAKRLWSNKSDKKKKIARVTKEHVVV